MVYECADGGYVYAEVDFGAYIHGNYANRIMAAVTQHRAAVGGWSVLPSAHW